MPGRKPTPTALRLIQGNPGKRPINKAEPKPKLAIPTCPPHLDAEARKEWRRISKPLYELGLLSVLDGDALAVYCASWSRWVAANEQLRDHGLTVPGRNGLPKASPYVAIANQAFRQMMSMAVEFGMTPSSRSRIRVVAPKAADPFEDLLRGR
jgi:P27 family predicted phage terminase small subunit